MSTTKSTQAKRDTSGKWWLVDGDGQVLGRLATRVASVLRGKHKPTYTPHVQCGDHVIVINAGKIRLTGRKLEQKLDYRHSGYPGGQKFMLYKDLMEKNPEKAVMLAVKGMLPKGPLGRSLMTRIRVYRDAKAAHQAQKPEPLAVRPVRSK